MCVLHQGTMRPASVESRTRQRLQSAARSPVAQLVEHPAVNRRVVGSSPTRGARPFRGIRKNGARTSVLGSSSSQIGRSAYCKRHGAVALSSSFAAVGAGRVRGEHDIKGQTTRAFALSEPSIEGLRRGVVGRAILVTGMLALVLSYLFPVVLPFVAPELPSVQRGGALPALEVPTYSFPMLSVPTKPDVPAAQPLPAAKSSPATAMPAIRTTPSNASAPRASVPVVDNVYTVVPQPQQAKPESDPFANAPIVETTVGTVPVLPEVSAPAPTAEPAVAEATTPAAAPAAEDGPAPMRVLASVAADEVPAEEPAASEETPAATGDPSTTGEESSTTSSGDPVEAEPVDETISSTSNDVTSSTETTSVESESDPEPIEPIAPAPVPQIVVAPVSVDFGSVLQMSTATQQIQIESVGDAELTINAVIVNGPEGVYAVATEGPLTLAPGSSATISATMTPGKAGTFTGTLTVQSDDPRSEERRV